MTDNLRLTAVRPKYNKALMFKGRYGVVTFTMILPIARPVHETLVGFGRVFKTKGAIDGAPD